MWRRFPLARSNWPVGFVPDCVGCWASAPASCLLQRSATVWAVAGMTGIVRAVALRSVGAGGCWDFGGGHFLFEFDEFVASLG